MLPRFALLTLLVSGFAAAAKPDKAGCKDSGYFTRMPGMFLKGCREVAFDARKFRVADPARAGKFTEESIEGHVLELTYNYEGDPRPSGLQWARNHQNAAKEAGGEVLFESPGGERATTLRLRRGGAEVWVTASIWGGDFNLVIVERQAMEQQVKVSAAALSSSLAGTGHAQVDGIFFDTGLAVVKPESTAALHEVAALMANEPTLKLRVVGHTDSVGTLEANLKLSQARADAVVQALVGQHKVAANRLTAHGVASLAPVASNRDDAGRARNRRVELIEQ